MVKLKISGFFREIHGITWQYMDIPGNAWLYMLIRKKGRSHSVMRGQQKYLFTIYINM